MVISVCVFVLRFCSVGTNWSFLRTQPLSRRERFLHEGILGINSITNILFYVFVSMFLVSCFQLNCEPDLRLHGMSLMGCVLS